MFSFHKPKIYRSNLGCCICKAKSSSSRFTDSKKYENEFERCFRIQEKRSGEICNACVLLVKRWKKLSPENRLTKHWHHVVDARAGPGTKLTGNRRLPGPSTSSPNSLSSSSSHAGNEQESHAARHRNYGHHSRADVLPLSSSQASNQSTGSSSMSMSMSSSASGASANSSATGKRTSSFSKVCAIDTNVSTFTFGEPTNRRNYMSIDHSPASSLNYSAIGALKPQSALNSSAFESVIKRFRQRQQQQQLEAQRRQVSRQQRLLRQQQQVAPNAENSKANQKELAPESSQKHNSNEAEKIQELKDVDPKAAIESLTSDQVPIVTSKRLKRSSESIGSLTVDGQRVSSILDASVWRKEKVCCGIIFCGPNNEVVVFPKLLKPCQRWAEQKKADHENVGRHKHASAPATARRSESPQPPPTRTTKSGSISSCDSSTSGTGSMEQATDEIRATSSSQKQLRRNTTNASRSLNEDKDSITSADSESKTRPAASGRKSEATRPTSVPTTRRKQQQQHLRQQQRGKNCDTDSNLSAASSSALSTSSTNKSSEVSGAMHSPASSSGASSTRMLMMADEDDELMELEDGVDPESSTNSSVESLAAREKSDALGAMG